MDYIDFMRTISTVSIPAGFSDALRPVCATTRAATPVRFQSLLGFLMRCDFMKYSNSGCVMQFQSLLGFLMRCDRTTGLSQPGEGLFQSLLGFLMRCDCYARVLG